MSEKKDQYNFGKLGRVELEETELDELERPDIVNKSEALKISLSTGAVLGTVTVYTTLYPEELIAGATGVP